MLVLSRLAACAAAATAAAGIISLFAAADIAAADGPNMRR